MDSEAKKQQVQNRTSGNLVSKPAIAPQTIRPPFQGPLPDQFEESKLPIFSQGSQGDQGKHKQKSPAPEEIRLEI